MAIALTMMTRLAGSPDRRTAADSRRLPARARRRFSVYLDSHRHSLFFLAVDAISHRHLSDPASYRLFNALQNVDDMLRRPVVRAMLRPAVPLPDFAARQLAPVHHRGDPYSV